MFPITVSQGYRLQFWNTMARSAPGPRTGEPHAWISPLLCVSRPATVRSRVDLPQPDAPTNVTNSPAEISSEIFSRAVTQRAPVPNTLCTARQLMALTTQLRAYR